MIKRLERGQDAVRHSAPGFGRMEGLVQEKRGVQEGRTGGARYDIIIPSMVIAAGLALLATGVGFGTSRDKNWFGLPLMLLGAVVVSAGAIFLLPQLMALSGAMTGLFAFVGSVALLAVCLLIFFQFVRAKYKGEQ